MARWGGATPYLDECNTTGLLHHFASQAPLGIPWSWLVYPHMEHWLVTQRLYSLLIAAFNAQQWDVRLETVCGAFAWAALAGFLVLIGGRRLRGAALGLWAVFVGLAQSIPHAWENLLWAFQIQFLFLVLFSLIAVRSLIVSPAFSLRWFGGVLAGALACLSQASGLLSFVAAGGGMASLALLNGGSSRLRQFAGIFVLAAMTALSRLTLPAAPWHDHLHAHDLGTWSRAASTLLAWPWSSHTWLALVLWTPGIVFCARLVIGREAATRENAVWFGILIWCAIQAGSAAWARGSILQLGLPPSRYADVLVIAAIANTWVLIRYWQRAACRGLCNRRGAAVALWLIMLVTGIVNYSGQLARQGSIASTVNQFSRDVFVASRELHAKAYREYEATGRSAALDVQPMIYPNSKDLDEVITKVKAAHRWPAALDSDFNVKPPLASRIAARAGIWGYALLPVAAGFAGLAIQRSRGRKYSLRWNS